MEQNATYKQLMLLPSEELTKPQKLFLDVHNEMVMAGRKSAECFLIMVNDMRRMKDEKLYKAAGFETFKEYVETALDIKERQAYNWMSVLDLPEAYLSKNAGMSITKLTLIASASQKVADELMEDETTAEKTVRELQAIIKEKEAKLEDKDKQISILSDELDAERERSNNAAEPVEVDTSAYEEKIEALQGELEEAQKNLERSNSKLATAENKIVELKNKKPKVETKTVEKTVEVENPETKQKLEQAQKDLSEAEAAAEKARAEKAEAEQKAQRAEAELNAYKKTQEAVAAFKVHAANLFDMWDTVIDAVKQIMEADSEYGAKCVAKLAAFNDTVKADIEGVK